MSDHEGHEYRFNAELKSRVSETLRSAVTLAAQRECSTPSDYIRRALASKLRADGIDPSHLQPAA